MKKYLLQTSLFFKLLVVGVLLTANSCKEDNLDPKQPPQDILAEAREAFTGQIGINQKFPILSSSSGKSFRHSLTKTPDWKNAEVKTLRKGKAVLVPINYSKNIFLKTGSTPDTYVSLKELTYLLIYNG